MPFTYTPSQRLDLVNAAGIQYGTLLDGASGGGDHGSSQATESYLVAYKDLRKFLLAVFTTPKSFGAGAGGSGVTYTIAVPQQHPNFTNLYANSYSYKTVKQVDGANVDASPWAYSIVTLGYQSFPYPMTGDYPFISRRVGGSGQILSLPRTWYTFSSSPSLKIDQAVGRLLPVKSIVLTKHRLPVVDEVLLDSLIGTVNSVDFNDTNGSVYSPGTLLFENYESSWSYDWSGNVTWEVSYSLQWRPVPWNEYLCPATGNFDTIQDPEGSYVYSSADLNVLLS